MNYKLVDEKKNNRRPLSGPTSASEIQSFLFVRNIEHFIICDNALYIKYKYRY